MNYATFWQRFAAMWIDAFILLPLVVVDGLVRSMSKVGAIILVVPVAIASAAYFIYFHAKFGQTVGKRVMKIRVVLTSGERIGWREAWLRNSVDLSFSILGVVGSLVALATISDVDYYGVGWMKQAQNLVAHEPSWLSWTWMPCQFWIWSEVVVMLFNRRRRALHDFIAGTVVTTELRNTSAEANPA
jgi:uncharacterized RDD family membrane protein YckC